MNRNINILFLGGARRTSFAERLILAGQKLNLHINIFSYELNTDIPLFSIAKEIIIGKRWNDPQLMEHLAETVKKKEINILLPFVDPAIEVLACFKKFIDDDNLFIPVSDVEIARIFFDKTLTQEWFIKNNIPIPLADNSYPKIAKPRTGSASKGIIIINNPQEENLFQKHYHTEDYVIQKYIIADEYTVDSYISVYDGKILGIVPRKRLEVLNGEVIKSITTKDEEIIYWTEKILKSDTFRGPITLQFLREKNSGQLFAMEINPRPGGGIINSIEAGFDVPLIILKEYMKIPVSPIVHWQENLMMIRTFKELFICKS